MARYTVGWIAPMALELTAAIGVLEERTLLQIPQDDILYHAGRIGNHHVVMAVCSRIGTHPATAVLMNMRRSFPNIKHILVVGIGGGMPFYGTGYQEQIVLGDVVVSVPQQREGGVVHYEFGAWENEKEFKVTGHTLHPSSALLTAVNSLRMLHSTKPGTRIPQFIQQLREHLMDEELPEFQDPGSTHDHLFDGDYAHTDRNKFCEGLCNFQRSKQRSSRGSKAIRNSDTPRIHYGNIGSSNAIVISSEKRNRLYEQHGIICFEMEAAGIVNDQPALIVRGICDYADSHKNKKWQKYAAATAAACAKEILLLVPADSSEERVVGPHQMSEDDRKCLEHLRVTNPNHDKSRIEDTKGGLLVESYYWVLENAEFRQWRDDPGSQLLWVKGDPGKGKTMLLCGIINELRKSIGDERNVSFFFCEATDSRLNNAAVVLRGLIYSIVNNQPSLLSHVRERYDSAGKALFEDMNAWFALSEIFTAILQDPGLKPTYLIVDALDECVNEQELLLQFIATKSSLSTRVKWLTSSRNWLHIEESLGIAAQKTKLSLELNAESVAKAVEAYICHRILYLKKLKLYSHNIEVAVHDYLSAHANGTFLWVALVCKALADPKVRKHEVLTKLRSFPPELDSLYARMLEDIDFSGDTSLCKQILAVSMIVRRPLNLQELISLIEVPSGISNDFEVLRELVTQCGSFLTIREDVIYFVHQSAKDFLLLNASISENHSYKSSCWITQVRMEEINYETLLRSLDAMSLVLKRDIYQLNDAGLTTDNIQVPEPDPLASVQYSCIHWVDHLEDLISMENMKNMKNRNLLHHNGTVYTSLRTKYLYWVEALSLLRNMNEGSIAIIKLECISRENECSFSDLVYDAYRFLMTHKSVIENSPLQAYSSALLFSPSNSLIKDLFKKETPNGIAVKSDIPTDWGACLQTLEGHSRAVYTVAFSPDGKKLASGSNDNTIILWDSNTGATLRKLKLHSSHITTISFSPDSKWLAAVSENPDSTRTNASVSIWDVNTGRELYVLKEQAARQSSAAFSPDGRTLAFCSRKATATLWDVRTGAALHTFHEDNHWIELIALSPNSEYLALLLDKTKIQIYCTSPCATLQSIEDTDDIIDLCFSSDNKRLMIASSIGDIKLIDITTRSISYVFRSPDTSVEAVAFSSDGKHIALAGRNKKTRLLDIDTGETLNIPEDYFRRVTSIAFSPSGTRLAIASKKDRMDNRVSVWNICAGIELQAVGAGPRISNLSFSLDGRQLIAVSKNRTIRVWNATAIAETQTHQMVSRKKFAALSMSNGKHIAGLRNDGKFEILDVHTGRRAMEFSSHQDVSNRIISISSDSRFLVSASRHILLKIWSATTETVALSLEDSSDWIVLVAFSPTGDKLVSMSRQGIIKIYDISKEKALHTLPCHGAMTVAFISGGKELAVASKKDKITIWDASTGVLKQTVKSDFELRTTAFTSSGTTIASASEKCIIKLWDTKTQKTMRTFKGHSGRIRALGFSPCNKKLASASTDQTVRLWHIDRGATPQIVGAHSTLPESKSGRMNNTTHEGEILLIRSHESVIYRISFSPDGKWLITYCANIANLWNARTGEILQTMQYSTHDSYDRYEAATFSPDGQYLAISFPTGQIDIHNTSTIEVLNTLESDSEITVWNTESWTILRKIHVPTFDVRNIAFTLDNELLVSTRDNGESQIWDFHDDSKPYTVMTNNIKTYPRDDKFRKLRWGKILVAFYPSIHSGKSVASDGHGDSRIAVQGHWLTWDERKVLWLPVERRPVFAAVLDNVVALGSASGLVSIIELTF